MNDYRQKLVLIIGAIVAITAWLNIFAVLWYWTLGHSSSVAYVLFVFSFLVAPVAGAIVGGKSGR